MKTLFFLTLGQLFVFLGIVLIISESYILPIISGFVGIGFMIVCYIIEEKEGHEIWPDVKTRMEQKHDNVHIDLKGKRRIKGRKKNGSD